MVASHQVLIAIGGNQPFGGKPPEFLVQTAVSRLREAGFVVEAVSKTYRTPCFPKGAGPDYVNGAVRLTVAAEVSAQDVLSVLHKIEADNGRERIKRWGARTLDLDLVAYDDLILPDAATFHHWLDLPMEEQLRIAPEELILPHPRIQDRAFVLVPLADVAPDWHHPVLGQTVRSLLAALSDQDRAEVRELT